MIFVLAPFVYGCHLGVSFNYLDNLSKKSAVSTFLLLMCNQKIY